MQSILRCFNTYLFFFIIKLKVAIYQTLRREKITSHSKLSGNKKATTTIEMTRYEDNQTLLRLSVRIDI